VKGNIGKAGVMRRWWGPDLKSEIELVGHTNQGYIPSWVAVFYILIN